VPRLDDDISSFPGMTVLGEQAEDAVRDAAPRYLTTEDDHAASWLGTNRYDKRAWAGYLALAAPWTPLGVWTTYQATRGHPG
jgi:hypothetical protein